jgi:hypothetical protein
MLSALVKRIGGKHYSLDQQLDFIGGQALTGRRIGVGRGVLFEIPVRSPPCADSILRWISRSLRGNSPKDRDFMARGEPATSGGIHSFLSARLTKGKFLAVACFRPAAARKRSADVELLLALLDDLRLPGRKSVVRCTVTKNPYDISARKFSADAPLCSTHLSVLWLAAN